MCPFFTTFILVVIIFVLFYIFLVWNFGYWKRRGVVEAKSYPFVGSFPSQFTQKRNFIYDIDDFYNQYKKDEYFIGVHSCRTPQLLILNTEYAHQIMVNDFKSFHDNEFALMVDRKKDRIFANNPFVLTGDEWKERRAEITPGLTSNRVNAVYPVTLEVCKSFSNHIKKQAKMADKNGIDCKELCLRYTTEVVSDCVLGIKANNFTDNPSPIYSTIKKAFDQSFKFILYSALVNLCPIIRKIYVQPFFAKHVDEYFFNLMQTSIDLRLKTKSIERKDFLHYMLQLREKKNLSTLELTSHTMTFLTDGFETTASVLAHTLLLLARYPEKQEKLRAELGTETLSFEQLNDLPFIDACVHESIRIFSPLLIARKLCVEPYEFVNKNGKSITIQPGTVVLLPVHSYQRDPDIYEDPEEFKPERFLEENGGIRHYREKGQYLGFGDGPRVCLGMRFALTQIKAALADIVRNFNVKVNPKTRKDNYLDEFYFMALLKGGIWLDFEERV